METMRISNLLAAVPFWIGVAWATLGTVFWLSANFYSPVYESTTYMPLRLLGMICFFAAVRYAGWTVIAYVVGSVIERIIKWRSSDVK